MPGDGPGDGEAPAEDEDDGPTGVVLPDEENEPVECERRPHLPTVGKTLLQTIEMVGGPKDGQRLVCVTLPCGCLALYDSRQALSLGRGVIVAAARLDNGIIDTRVNHKDLRHGQ